MIRKCCSVCCWSAICNGITSERRLMKEVRMHLAYRWFTRLGFVCFGRCLRRSCGTCLEASLAEGQNLAVDGTLVGANASYQSRVPREQLAEVAQVSRTVQQYLAELEQQNPVAESEEPPQGTSSTV